MKNSVPNYSVENNTFYVFGDGDFLVPVGADTTNLNRGNYNDVRIIHRTTGGQYHLYETTRKNISAESIIPLFTGYQLQAMTALKTTTNLKEDALPKVSLKTVRGNALASFAVKIDNARVSSSSVTNRRLAAFTMNFTNSVNSYLAKFHQNATTDNATDS